MLSRFQDITYTYRAEYSPEAGHYVGLCVELPWLSRTALTAREAVAAVEEAVDDMAARGQQLPPPLMERKYSGKFVVRTSPALHARLTVEATEQGVSMNQWVVQKLSGREPARDDCWQSWLRD